MKRTPANNVLIRPARTTDFDALLRLFELVAAERLWIGTEPGFDQNAYRLGWKRMVEQSVGAIFVAIENDDVVGTLSVRPNSEHGGEIGMLVSPGHRGKGIGAALLAQAIEWASQQGQPSLCLYVFPHNSAAIRLYKRAGFVEKQRYESLAKRQNGDEWDVLLMTLLLEYETHGGSEY